MRAITNDDETLLRDTDLYVNMVMSHLPASDNRLYEVKQAQDSDEICKTVIRYCREGWPQQVKGPIKKFVAVSSGLSIHNGLLLKGHRLVIPPSMQSNILDSIHAGHQGITNVDREPECQCGGQALTSSWKNM